MPETATATESRSKKKTTKKTTRRKKYSEDEVQGLVKKAQEEAVEKARAEAESDFIDEFEDTEEIPGLDMDSDDMEGSSVHMHQAYFEETPSAEQQVAQNAFDIFDWIEENFVQNGTTVVYRVKRSGSFVGEHYHPLSWNDIQKTYGGGNYSVEARDASSKRYLKQQTLLIHEPLIKEKKEEKEDRPVFTPPPAAPQLDPNTMMSSLMGAFQKMQEMSWEDRRKEDRDEKRSENQFNSTFLTLMQNQQQSTQTMFMEMQKNTQEMMKSISENFSKSQERMDDKFSKMIEKISDGGKGKEEFGLKEMLMLQQSAEDRGWDKMKMLLDLSEAKAEERLAVLEAGGGETKDSSMIGDLVKGILPLLSGASQQQQMILARQAQAHQQRGSLPGRQPSQTASQAPRSQGRTVQNPAPESGRSAQKKPPQEPQGYREENPLGLPTFSDMGDEGVETASHEVETERSQVIDVTPRKEPRTIEEIYAEASPAAQAIANIAVPRIAELIMNDSVTPQQAAGLCLDECQEAGFDRDVILQEFSFDFMLQIAGCFGLAETKKQWFEDFYAHIQDSSGMDAEGEDQPTLS